MENIIFQIFTLLGGLAFFLFGMNIMSSGLEKMAGGKLEGTLTKMTSNKMLGLIFGAVVTIAIQSSSALTVMLVGLVNSGLMQFGQTISVLMGSNIGTTLTAWLLSLAGIEGEAWYLELLKPKNFAAIFAFVGILLNMIAKSEKKKSMGSIFIGFAILMSGMTFMSDSMKPLAESEAFASILVAFSNPLVAVLIGAIFTGIIQSSAASVGILQALSLSGGITYGMAIPIIMGQNIGTCVTAVLSSIGVNKNARKVSVVHMAFNIIGTLIFLIPLLILDWGFNFAPLDREIDPFMIAVCHSIFNVVTTFILLPFTKQLENIANRMIPVEEKAVVGPKLDDRLLGIPAVAIGSASDATNELSGLSFKAFSDAITLMGNYSAEGEADIKEQEEIIDLYEDKLGTYMVKLSREELSVADSRKLSRVLHTINDFERIGDHACNLAKVAREMSEKQIIFSESAQKEIGVLEEAIKEIMDLTHDAFVTLDVIKAARVEPLEQVIDKMIYNIKKNHTDRLQQGECTIELGFVLHDLLTNYERVSDHCSNIAVAVIETEHGSFETHEYLHTVKAEETGDFAAAYAEYKARYIK